MTNGQRVGDVSFFPFRDTYAQLYGIRVGLKRDVPPVLAASDEEVALHYFLYRPQ